MTNKENKKQKIGIAYIRESTEEQDKGFSPQNQERSIKEYAQKNNIIITKVYKDLISAINNLDIISTSTIGRIIKLTQNLIKL
ncbi:MAG: recombinase family protein [Candidatus Pacebacteria bacterium]|nr:recombinase family protein [Candidatus Paceibacterota bacterium]